MACYHPNKALWYGDITANGEKKYTIIPESGPKVIGNKAFKTPLEEMEVPCGKCIGCRLDYSRQWANRCMLEAKSWTDNYMITLTYDDDHAHWVRGVDQDTGEITNVTTLEPEDITKFMKDLRRSYSYHNGKKNIRFYGCGEYGSKTHRAHMHIILFNCYIEDLEPFFLNKDKQQVYLSERIRGIWGKGIVSVVKLEWQVAAYVARYVMKKRKGKESKEWYEKLGIQPEFVRMSRKPGIGRNYYEENRDTIYAADEIHLERKNGNVMTIKPCKYYDRLFDLDSPEAMQAIKQERKLAMELSIYNQLKNTNLTKKEYLKVKEQNKIAQTEKLKRTL